LKVEKAWEGSKSNQKKREFCLIDIWGILHASTLVL
jgi:hypothetical protein